MADEQWMALPPLPVVVNHEETVFARAKVFSTGSKGWYASGKIMVDGLKCQVSVCITVVGSKKGTPQRGDMPGQGKIDFERQAGPDSPSEVAECVEPILEVEGRLPKPWTRRRAS